RRTEPATREHGYRSGWLDVVQRRDVADRIVDGRASGRQDLQLTELGRPDAKKRRRWRRFGVLRDVGAALNDYPIRADRSSGAGSGATVSGGTGGWTSSR